jgi:hypothetical protein
MPPPEQVEQFLNDVTDGGMDNAIGTMIGQFLPNPDEIRELLIKLLSFSGSYSSSLP